MASTVSEDPRQWNGSAGDRAIDDSLSHDVKRVLAPDGTPQGPVPELSDGQLVELYRAMKRTRVVDERAVLLQRQGRIGFHIGSLGEEAAIIGSAAALREADWMFPCYREFGAALWRGLPLRRFIDNLYGNGDDLSKGRQMPDHWCSRAAAITSVSSPIGTQITQAVGFAWAAKLRGDPLVVMVYFGEGATSSAEFHNGLNFAGVFGVPVVFVCRNNGWAISVPAHRQTASATFAAKGVAYGVDSVRCDGNDLLAVLDTSRVAVAQAAAGGGPTLIEALTYRVSGHSTSDDAARYRDDDEVEVWRALDPIVRVERYLRQRVGWSQDEQRALEAELEAELRQAIEAAEQAPAPAVETLFDDVYRDLPWHLREQRDELLRGPRVGGEG